MGDRVWFEGDAPIDLEGRITDLEAAIRKIKHGLRHMTVNGTSAVILGNVCSIATKAVPDAVYRKGEIPWDSISAGQVGFADE